MASSFNQRIVGTLVAPTTDPAWRRGTPAARLAFFRAAGERAVALKRAELARGIGANGRRMAARAEARRDGASGPVLTPHGEDSRTSRLLASHATVEGLTLFWRSGHSRAQRLPWGTILGFHARGQVPGAPVRDVRLSKRGINQLRVEMASWWTKNRPAPVRRDKVVTPPTPNTAPAPLAARPTVAAQGKAAARKAAKALVAKYASLADYLNPRGGGF